MIPVSSEAGPRSPHGYHRHPDMRIDSKVLNSTIWYSYLFKTRIYSVLGQILLFMTTLAWISSSPWHGAGGVNFRDLSPASGRRAVVAIASSVTGPLLSRCSCHLNIQRTPASDNGEREECICLGGRWSITSQRGQSGLTQPLVAVRARNAERKHTRKV